MIMDRMLSFFENATIPATKSTETAGRTIDLRLNGDGMNECLNIIVLAVGAPPMADSSNVATVVTKIYTSATGADNSWGSAIATQNSDGNVLFKGKLPDGTKRFVRATITTPKGAGDSGTNLAAAFVAKGGIVVGEVEGGSVPLQSFPPLQDVAGSTAMTVI